jgi:hypothetical protein
MTSAFATPVSSIKVPTQDFTAIKLRQHAAWSSGDCAVVGITLQIVGETLADAVDARADERLLALPLATVTPRWPLRADTLPWPEALP